MTQSLSMAKQAATGASAPAATRQHVLLIWLVVTVLTSSAGILTRYCHVPAASIGFWRVMGAAIVLLPWWLAVWRRAGRPTAFPFGASLTGLFLGVHFATWSWAIQHATIANAMLFIGLQPLMAPFVARPLVGERLTRGEIVAALLACLGMVWILQRQLVCGRDQLAGSLVALGSAFLCACYFVLTRKYRRHQQALLFSFPVYVTAAAVQAVIGICFSGGIHVGGPTTRLALLGLILLPTVGGHTLAMYLLKHVKSQLVTLSIPAQFVLGSISAVFLFGEVPSIWFYPGAALVLAGVILGVAKSQPASSA